jgi:hypothetical protein
VSNIDALMGMGISDEEQQRMLADRLRGRQQAADFFSLSTVAPISQAAQAEQKRITSAAQEAGVLKKAMEAQQAQDARQAAQIAATEREGGLNRANRLEAARIAAAARMAGKGKPGGYDPSKPYGALKTAKERADFDTLPGELASIDVLAETYKDEYGPMVPWSGNIETALGKALPGDKWGWPEQANYYGNFEAFHNLMKRHKIFGSAFTKVEQEAWNRAYFDANTQPEVARNRLRMMQHMARRAAEASAIKAYESNVNMDLIENSYGDVIDVEGLLDTWENNREAYQQKRSDDLMTAAQFLKQEGVEDKSIAQMLKGAADKVFTGEDNSEKSMQQQAVPDMPDVENRKVVGGTTYVKRNGKWYEE